MLTTATITKPANMSLSGCGKAYDTTNLDNPVLIEWRGATMIKESRLYVFVLQDPRTKHPGQ